MKKLIILGLLISQSVFAQDNKFNLFGRGRGRIHAPSNVTIQKTNSFYLYYPTRTARIDVLTLSATNNHFVVSREGYVANFGGDLIVIKYYDETVTVPNNSTFIGFNKMFDPVAYVESSIYDVFTGNILAEINQ